MIIGVLLCGGVVAPVRSAVLGNSVVAKPGGDALIVWDASTELIRLENAKLSSDRISASLEHDALSVAAKNLSAIEKNSRSVSVRIVYVVSGGMSEKYHAETFGHTEHYALLTLPYRNAAANLDHWKSLAPAAPIPHWVRVKITGSLPP